MKLNQEIATTLPLILLDLMKQRLEPLTKIRAQLDAAHDKSGT